LAYYSAHDATAKEQKHVAKTRFVRGVDNSGGRRSWSGDIGSDSQIVIINFAIVVVVRQRVVKDTRLCDIVVCTNSNESLHSHKQTGGRRSSSDHGTDADCCSSLAPPAPELQQTSGLSLLRSGYRTGQTDGHRTAT